jgi:hypothetical protein
MRVCFHKGRGHYEYSNFTNGKIQHENQSLIPNGNDLDVLAVTRDGLERMAAVSDVNLGIRSPKVDDMIVYQPKDTPAMCLVSIQCAVEPRLS